MYDLDRTNPRNKEFLEKRNGCENFIYQCDRNGEIAIWYCNLLGKEEDKNFEGNCGRYPCPLGFKVQ
jgi:hypothetical protein